MVNFNRLYSSLFVCMFFPLLSDLAAAATAVPNPPQQICIDDTNCSTTPAPGAGIKWHPGNYAGYTFKKCESSYDSNNLSLINEIGSIPNFKGILVTLYWGCLEGNTAGDYAAGFARIDALLARLAQQTPNRYLMLSISTDDYNAGGTCEPLSGGNGKLPTYIVNMGSAGYLSCPNGSFKWIANFGNAATVDRMIALSAAYAARYNDNPLFEGISFIQETASQSVLTLGGSSYTTIRTQLARLHAAAAKQWTKTHVRMPANYFGNDGEMQLLIDAIAKNNNAAFGPPDTYPEEWRSRRFPSNYVYRGLSTSLGIDILDWSDLRGKYAWIAEIQSPDIGPQYGQVNGVYVTLQETYNWAYQTLRATHIVWTPNSWQVPSQNSWANQKLFVSSGKSVLRSACPTAFSAGCDTN